MPLLNPGIVVSSAYLADDLVIVQRAVTVGTNGRGTLGRVEVASWGIVCNAGPNDLERLPEESRTTRVLSIITNAQVQPVGPSNEPDLIRWPISGAASEEYIVLAVGPYPNYGEGWYQILAGSPTRTEVPL